MDQITNDIYQYISEQGSPVSVRMIMQHLPAKQDKRTINRILIALCRCGNLKRSLKDGKAYYIASDAALHQMLVEPDANFAEPETEDPGPDLPSSTIGDTGFDMYDWTFTKGVRRQVSKWSVGIPDGFSIIRSAENRAFEAVPQGQEDVDEEERKVWIGAGQYQTYEVDMPAYYDPYARQGFMDVQATTVAKFFQSTVLTGTSGITLDAFSVATNDVSAIVTASQAEDGAAVYQVGIPTGEKMQILQVRIFSMTPAQRKRMDHSVLEWLKTFHGSKPNLPAPALPKLSDINLVKQIKRGDLSAFDLAVKQAYDEEKFSLVGTIVLIGYRMNNGIPVENAEAAIREGLEHGAEVAVFYTRLADELCGKLKKESVSSETMFRVYTKLQELIMEIGDINIDGKPIRYSVPDDVKRISEKWAAAMEKANAKAEAERYKKREEDRQKTAAKTRQRKIHDYLDAEKKWSDACAHILAEQEKLVNAKINAEKEKILASAIKEKETALKKANAEVKEQTDRKKAAEAALASLGVFKFSEKKTQKEIIAAATKQIASAQANIEKANKDYTFKTAAADASAKAKRSEFQEQAKAEIPFPAEPQRPDFIMEREAQLTRQDAEKVEEKRRELRSLLDFMRQCRKNKVFCTTQVIRREFPDLQATRIRELSKEGLLGCDVVMSNLVYYVMPDADQLVDKILPIPKPRYFSEEELQKMASEEK